jgi:hypothetical protein
MILLGLSLGLFLLGLVVLAATPTPTKPLDGIIAGTALFLAILGLLWASTLMLPPEGSWFAALLGASLLTLARNRPRHNLGSGPLLPLVLAAAVAALSYHYTLALFDLAMSTRRFASPNEIWLAGFERSVSASSLGPSAVIVGSMGIGLLVGQLVSNRFDRGRLPSEKPE